MRNFKSRDNRHNISHTYPILIEGGKAREEGQIAWLHSKKKNEKDRNHFRHSRWKELKKKSKREYKYIGDEKEQVFPVE